MCECLPLHHTPQAPCYTYTQPQSFSLWEFSWSSSFVSSGAWATSVEWHPGPVKEDGGRQWKVNITSVFKYENYNACSQHISAELRSSPIAITPTSIQPLLIYPRSSLTCLIPHFCLLASSTNEITFSKAIFLELIWRKLKWRPVSIFIDLSIIIKLFDSFRNNVI